MSEDDVGGYGRLFWSVSYPGCRGWGRSHSSSRVLVDVLPVPPRTRYDGTRIDDYGTYLVGCVLTYLPTHPHTYFTTFVPTYYLPTHVPTFLPIYLPTDHSPTYPSYLPIYLS